MSSACRKLAVGLTDSTPPNRLETLSFPLLLGSLTFPPSWLRIISASEAVSAGDEGLVAIVSPTAISCYRTSTFDALDDGSDLFSDSRATCVISPETRDAVSDTAAAAMLQSLHAVVCQREHMPKFPLHRWWDVLPKQMLEDGFEIQKVICTLC